MIELPFDSQSFPNCLFREAFCQLFFHNLPTIFHNIEQREKQNIRQ